jgi:ADP-ribosylglycohydrolase
MTDNAKAMVLASFAADALALGAHWIYDTELIDQKIGRPDTYTDPTPPTFHGTKKAGDFTHYGDQTLLLLESIAAASGFDPVHFAASWQTFFDGYGGYFDGATKSTLKHLENGADIEKAGSASNDLAGAARIAPLVYYYRHDAEKLLYSSRAQTAFTHNHTLIIDAAAAFSRIALASLAGTPPRQAVSTALAHPDTGEVLSGWMSKGLESVDMNTREAIGRFGQMCEIDAALPATVHLIAKYEDSLQEALIENVRAGGDSAGRGLLVGMILGAHLGPEAIPSRWLTEMKACDRITALVAQLDGGSE